MKNLYMSMICLLTIALCFGICHAKNEQVTNLDRLEKLENPSDFQIGTFMVGPPHSPSPNLELEFKRVKKLGFNYVHWYCISFHPEKSIQRYMDLAHKNGLKVLFDISKPLQEFRATRKKTFEQAMRDFKAQANRWKDHPALGMWYIYDEPHAKNISPAELQKFNQYLKELTPEKKTSIALCWEADWRDYLRTADVIMPDFYPVTTKRYPENKLKHQHEFFSRVRVFGKKSTIPLVQQFGFPNLPNMTEMRYIALTPLIDGVTGIHFWGDWFACKEPFKKGEFDKEFNNKIVGPVIKDLKELVRLAHPVNKVRHLPELGNPVYGLNELIACYWKRRGKMYILTANNCPRKRKVSIPFNRLLRSAKLQPILSTRDTNSEVKNWSATIEMEPWETFIWQVDLRK